HDRRVLRRQQELDPGLARVSRARYERPDAGDRSLDRGERAERPEIERGELAERALRFRALEREQGELGADVHDLRAIRRALRDPCQIRRSVRRVHDEQITLDTDAEDDQVVEDATRSVAEDRVLAATDAEATDVVHRALLADRLRGRPTQLDSRRR